MKLFLTFILFLCVSQSYAQDLTSELRGILVEIDQRLHRNHDQQTLLRVRERLRSTLDLLSGIAPPPPPVASRSLVCLARDNDGRDPWILGVKDPITLRQSALPFSNIGSRANCEAVKNSAVTVRDSIFTCVTRDNDGQNPWTISHYRDGVLVSRLNTLGSLANCVNALNHAARSSQAVAFCATRDNDGQAPWIQMSVVAATGEIHRAGSYGSLEQCLSAKIKLQLED